MKPERVGLVFLWLVTAAIGVWLLVQDVRQSEQYGLLRWALHAAYVAMLLWYLARNGPSVGDLPEQESRILRRWRYGSWIPVLGMALLFLVIAGSDDGADILMLLLIAATAWVLVAWWRDIRLRAVVQGLVLAAIAYLAGLPAARHGIASEAIVVVLPALTAPMYVAGGLLFDRTRLGGIELRAAEYGTAIRGFFWGVVLFTPLGLFNAADGSPSGDVSWLTEWWMPMSLPWFSGISEEVWFRLLFVGLTFFLVRPAFRGSPGAAVVVVILFTGVVFGLAHGRSVGRLLTTGLLYGVPLGAVFARRGFEHAVGAHYAINAFPWLMAFLET